MLLLDMLAKIQCNVGVVKPVQELRLWRCRWDDLMQAADDKQHSGKNRDP